MLCNYYSENILGLQDVIIKNIVNNEKTMEISIELPQKFRKCPKCGKYTNKIHDYRYQKVKDIPAFGKSVILNIHKRRYECECGKHFIEPIDFLPKYYRMTQRAIVSMLEHLANVHSYTDTAKEYSVSAETVIRYFENIQYSKPNKLPEVMGIDEFKGNSGGEKFLAILTDINKKEVIDILKTRKETALCDYFKRYDRSNVKYFVSDMYEPYAEMARTYFSKATYVIDRYHWIRQAIWAFEAVRKETQKLFQSNTEYISSIQEDCC